MAAAGILTGPPGHVSKITPPIVTVTPFATYWASRAADLAETSKGTSSEFAPGVWLSPGMGKA